VLASTDTADDGSCVSGVGNPLTASVRKVALIGRGPVAVMHPASTATAAHSPATRTGVLCFGGRGPERTRLPRRLSGGLPVGLATLCGLSHQPRHRSEMGLSCVNIYAFLTSYVWSPRPHLGVPGPR
jgi:hypothetical protein